MTPVSIEPFALQLDIRTRTEGYYERMGASRSLGFRLLRANLGLGEAPAGSVNKAAEPE